MEKFKIGIPKIIYSYDEGKFLKYFLEELNFSVIIPNTSYSNINNNDNFCLPINYIVEDINYLKDKCDYIINIKFINEGIDYQGCPNNLLLCNIINNICKDKILNITIDHYNYKTLYKELIKIFNKVNIDKKMIKNAYLISKIKVSKERKSEIIKNTNKLYTNKKKFLLIGHSYLLEQIYDLLKLDGLEFIYYNKFDKDKLKEYSFNRNNIYYKYGKEVFSAIEYTKSNINGIIYISSLRCDMDLYINEILSINCSLPYLNVFINDFNISDIESFIKTVE